MSSWNRLTADRSHGPKPDYEKNLAAIIEETYARAAMSSSPVLRSAAHRRSSTSCAKSEPTTWQRVLKIWRSGWTPRSQSEATRIFDEQTRECFDEETLALMDAGINPLQFDGLRLAITSDESKTDQ